MDPYEILGLNYPCSKEEIKARYYELAKKHHPDKHQHLSNEEISVHEQEFKKINLAYELLTKKEFEYTTKKEWKGIWENMNVSDLFSNPELLRNMGDILKNVMNVAQEYKKQKATEHNVTVDVTLEDVFHRKEKKLRLFLKGIIEPVFIHIDCGCYPSFLCTHITPDERTRFIHVTFQLIPHDIYSLDSVFDTKDILCNLELNLYEYMYGCEKTLDYLDKTQLKIPIDKCCLDTIEIPHKGLHGQGKLLIFPKVSLPTKEGIEQLNEYKKEKLQRYLKVISDAPHSGHLEMKSI